MNHHDPFITTFFSKASYVLGGFGIGGVDSHDLKAQGLWAGTCQVHFFETSCAKKEGVDAALQKAPGKKKKRFKRVVDDPDSNQKKTHFSRELGGGCFIFF